MEAIHFEQALRIKLLAGLDVPIPHAVAGALQRQLPALFTFAQSRLSLPAFGDILPNRRAPDRPPLLPERGAPDMDPDVTAPGGDHFEFNVIGPGLIDNIRIRRLDQGV